MDFGKLVEGAFAYARDGVFARTDRWMKLILATILLGIPLSGYVMRIYRGASPAPEVDEWGTLFGDGLKLMIIGLIYAIPIIIFAFAPILFMPGFGTDASPAHAGPLADSDTSAGMGAAFFLILVSMLFVVFFEIVIAILLPIASIRFARTGAFWEAFNFGAILATIGAIGWFNYIIALILVMILIGVPIFILEMIVLFAGIAAGHMFIALGLFVLAIIIIAPVLATFQARYMTEIYDSPAVPEAQTQVPV